MELGIRIEQLGIVLVMGPGVAEIAEIARRSLLDGEDSLFQMGRIGARAQDSDLPACRGLGILVSAKVPYRERVKDILPIFLP